MKKTITLFALILLYSILSSSYADYYEGELIVQITGDHQQPLKIEESISKLVSDYEFYDLQVERFLSNRLRIYLFSFNPLKIETSLFLSLLKEHPSVEAAQFNHKVALRETLPDDPLFDQQWALLNTGQSGGTPGADIGATLAWDIATGGETANGHEIVIAVIDNGFDLNHPDIDFWKNLNEIPGSGNDDDGNGYVDDYDGWNAYNNSGVIPSANHGTHVSGIAGAVGNNDTGVSGVNWGVKIMPIAGSSTSEATVVAAYGYVHEMRSLYNDTGGDLGAYIVATNSSFGVNYGQPDNYPLWGAMYDAMGEVGIVSAAATMNINANVDQAGDVPTAFPSPYLLGVTNTTRNDLKNTGAAYGATTIDLGAPGTQVLSTTPNNNYGNSSGTSMASPHVAGAIGLMYAVAPAGLLSLYEEDPGELALLMIDLLLQGVDVIPALEDITVSGGRLNLNNALQMVLDYEYEIITPAPYDLNAEYTGESVLLTWESSDDRFPQFFDIYRNEMLIATEDFNNNTFVDTDIYPGWTYEYYIIAGYLDPDGFSEPSETVIVIIPPAAPLLIYPENEESGIETDLILQWEEVFGSDSYLLEVAFDENFDEYFLEPVTTQQNSYQLPVLGYNMTYFWHIAALNEGGTSEWSQTYFFTTEEQTSTEEESEIASTTITRIFPNPFNLGNVSRSNILQIDLTIEHAGKTALMIFNIRGQSVRNLITEELSPGNHSIFWNGADDTGKEVGSGIYFIRLSTGETQEISKILLLK
jgi:hypothetical protein